MRNYLPLLKQSPIFKSLDETFILHTIRSLRGYKKDFIKNEIIYNNADHIQYAGIVLKGVVSETMINSNHNEYGVRNYKEGEIFGDEYSFSNSERSLAQFVSKTDSTLLFLKISTIFNPRTVNCPKVNKLTQNLLQESYANNISKNKNIHILIQKQIRSKIIIYLSRSEAKNNTITLPLNRCELANHLGVERSALSRELSRMKAEHLIDFKKNKIHILKNSLLDLV